MSQGSVKGLPVMASGSPGVVSAVMVRVWPSVEGDGVAVGKGEFEGAFEDGERAGGGVAGDDEGGAAHDGGGDGGFDFVGVVAGEGLDAVPGAADTHLGADDGVAG